MWYSNEQVKEKLLEYVLSCQQHLSEHYLKNSNKKEKWKKPEATNPQTKQANTK